VLRAVRMYSKFRWMATSALLVFLSGCGSFAPWRNEPVGTEVNLAFTLQNNLLFLPSATVNGRGGRLFFSSASARSVIDPRFAETLPESREYTLRLNDKQALRFSPAFLDLGGTGDGMIGADVWGRRAITIDYQSGLLTFQKEGIHSGLMTLYRFTAEPIISIDVDGRTISAVVDTASPDTLVLPRAAAGRGRARLAIAGTEFGSIDVGYANISRAHVGNRVLSKFLMTIDYGRHQVGLWRDPRIPL
jgi:hypothetical protein